MAAIEDLGFPPGTRVVVVHVDDIGMSSAANSGALIALDGSATCGSIMVPCPGFDEIAATARARPELDLGVHLTLNAEYDSYRWGPVSKDVPGLVSPDGGMWRTTEEVVAHASADEVESEARAQIERALDAGIDVTHVDSHMGTIFNLKFVSVYFRVARDYRLPAFIPRIRSELLAENKLPPNLEKYVEIIGEAETCGFPIFDQFDQDSLHFEPGSGLEHNSRRLQKLAGGLSYLITHCAQGGPELEGITADWRQRDEEHRIYSDGSIQRVLEAGDLHTIGMRPLRELLRSRI